MRKIKNNILRFPADRAIEVSRQRADIAAFNYALDRELPVPRINLGGNVAWTPPAEAPDAPWLVGDELQFGEPEWLTCRSVSSAEVVSLCEFRKTKKIEKSG